MWQDMVLYWAWRGPKPKDGLPPTPTIKRIEYAEIIGPGRYINGPKPGEPIHRTMAVTVYDNNIPTEVHRNELEWYRKVGAEIRMPANA